MTGGGVAETAKIKWDCCRGESLIGNCAIPARESFHSGCRCIEIISNKQSVCRLRGTLGTMVWLEKFETSLESGVVLTTSWIYRRARAVSGRKQREKEWEREREREREEDGEGERDLCNPDDDGALNSPSIVPLTYPLKWKKGTHRTGNTRGAWNGLISQPGEPPM